MDKILSLYRAMRSTAQIMPLVEGLEGWPSLEVQRAILEGVLNDPFCAKYPPAKSYTKQVLKALISSLQNSNTEVDEDLFAMFFDYLGEEATITDAAQSQDSLPFCNYSVPDKAVVSFRLSRQLNPVGLATWPAGFMLTELALYKPEVFENKRILELGAGVGITGIAIAKWMTVEKLVMTDYLGSVLDNLSYNVEINELDKEKVEVSSLDWEDPEDNGNESAQSCPLIIAADCVYDPDLARALSKVLGRLLKPDDPKSYALIVNTVRQLETLEAFKEGLRKMSVEWEEFIKAEEIPQLIPYDRPVASLIWKCTKKKI